ncbi:MAG TPA: pyridoxamine 5'-phosphate oxidase family protein [Candidatus Micrarchaeaceae archaeon]|nr:pyridoxamine 5'-phosphate oxidase family protein [Candidatus Micrarchaeaceae archaeon]
MAESRTIEARKTDVVASLEGQQNLWLATADSSGHPHLIAVSAWWDGSDLVMATIATSRTAKNLTPGREVRLAGGTPADAIVVQARVIETQAAAAAPDVAQGFAKAMGWDPRQAGEGWAFFRLRPIRIQAYRGYEELEGRDVMRNSRWLA